ncbi:hypothetical protein QCE47_17705 [Caballeronia sp. LZ025]|uniref:hypothetical protein n=1 Tax=Caballeronia TaxID=1827195 RepID=UPI001FD04C6B|nr:MULTISPECIES: hypothetical protein [Caballeronia]MDR5734147.1 hypothetical protein [Caballeronia sp. LZ025]
MKRLLHDEKGHETPEERAQTTERQKADALSRYVRTSDQVRRQLCGFICEAPSEWDKFHNETRFTKLLEDGEFYHGNQTGYDKFLKYLGDLQFWDKTGFQLGQKLWYFHPLAFIRQFRKCGWLSSIELARCLPRSSISANIDWDTAYSRACNHHVYVNYVFGRCLNGRADRLLHFLAKAYIETGCLRTMTEDSLGHGHVYGPFYGRGYLQLTWPQNYEKYKNYRCIPNHGGGSYSDPRITSTSTHFWSDGAPARRCAPLFDPGIVAADLMHAAESSAMYWISKTFRGTNNINRAADISVSPLLISFISWLINGGGNGYKERQQFAALLADTVLDVPMGTSSQVLSYPPLAPPGNPVLCRTFPPTVVPYTLNVAINHVPQIP